MSWFLVSWPLIFRGKTIFYMILNHHQYQLICVFFLFFFTGMCYWTLMLMVSITSHNLIITTIQATTTTEGMNIILIRQSGVCVPFLKKRVVSCLYGWIFYARMILTNLIGCFRSSETKEAWQFTEKSKHRIDSFIRLCTIDYALVILHWYHWWACI